ncbi:MAG: hypothetical protein Q8K58_10470 [Acidimicrobiales bacterium]|nr:hypothetical protein [Acidimicrobiales bacterium]
MDGLLRVGQRWIAIPDAQLPIVRLLLDRPMRVVRHEEILVRYQEAGGKGELRAVKSMLTRLTRRLDKVGLVLVSVRSRGVRLEWAPA